MDTSVWVDHFRARDDQLIDLLERTAVVMHPFVVGELACGTLANRNSTVELLQQLPAATLAEHGEVLGFIAQRKLFGKGVGYVDAHLLASVAIGGDELWTRDRRLRTLALKLGCASSAE